MVNRIFQSMLNKVPNDVSFFISHLNKINFMFFPIIFSQIAIECAMEKFSANRNIQNLSIQK